MQLHLPKYLLAVVPNLPAEGGMVAGVGPVGDDLPVLRCELDSHANTIVLGSEAFYFESGKKFCHVSPYDRSTTRTLPR